MKQRGRASTALQTQRRSGRGQPTPLTATALMATALLAARDGVRTRVDRNWPLRPHALGGAGARDGACNRAPGAPALRCEACAGEIRQHGASAYCMTCGRVFRAKVSI